MKKVTALIIILLANIILLAHAVMPHHHHQLQFCIEDTHCSHQNNPFNNSHDHDGESSSDCILKQLIIFPSNHARQECKCIDLTDIHFPHGLNAIELNYEFHYFGQTKVSEIDYPWIKLSYPHLLSASSGLRAPPAV